MVLDVDFTQEIHHMSTKYYTDGRQTKCRRPSSIENLHAMAEDLNIKRCWFHKDHYDIPKLRMDETEEKCIMVSQKEIVRIINGKFD